MSLCSSTWKNTMKKGERKMILLILYVAAGYWACGVTIFANKIRIGSSSALFGQRVALGLMFGWILIPVALIRVIFHI